MRDEGPSSEDLERFGNSDGVGYCPECGEELWDDAPACSECGAILHDGTMRRTPLDTELTRRATVVIAFMVIVGLLIWLAW